MLIASLGNNFLKKKNYFPTYMGSHNILPCINLFFCFLSLFYSILQNNFFSSIFIYLHFKKINHLKSSQNVVGKKEASISTNKGEKAECAVEGLIDFSPCNTKFLNGHCHVQGIFPTVPLGGRKPRLTKEDIFTWERPYSEGSNLSHLNVVFLAWRPSTQRTRQRLTRPGITRLSTPIKSFLSSCSFWKFSILIIVPWSCATISVISAKAAEEATRHTNHSINGSPGCFAHIFKLSSPGWCMCGTEPRQKPPFSRKCCYFSTVNTGWLALCLDLLGFRFLQTILKRQLSPSRPRAMQLSCRQHPLGAERGDQKGVSVLELCPQGRDSSPLPVTREAQGRRSTERPQTNLGQRRDLSGQGSQG